MCHVVGCGGGRADSPSPNTRLERGRSGGVGEGGDGEATHAAADAGEGGIDMIMRSAGTTMDETRAGEGTGSG